MVSQWLRLRIRRSPRRSAALPFLGALAREATRADAPKEQSQPNQGPETLVSRIRKATKSSTAPETTPIEKACEYPN